MGTRVGTLAFGVFSRGYFAFGIDGRMGPAV